MAKAISIKNIALESNKNPSGKIFCASPLPFMTLNYSPDGKSITFPAARKSWKYNTETNNLEANNATEIESSMRQRSSTSVLSPDGQRGAFIRNYNWWVCDVATNKETQ